MFDRSARADEVGALRSEIERLRAFVEVRVQAQEDMMRALTMETRTRMVESVEQRIQLAAREAIAFAEGGLVQHEAALRALGRRVAELSREAPPLRLPERSGLAAPCVQAYLIGVDDENEAGCLKIELRDGCEDTFLADLANLPILPGAAEKLVAGHIVERTRARELTEDVLPHWRERLAPGGELVVLTLDGPAWTADLARRAGDFESLRAHLGADRDRPAPRNLFDEEALSAALLAAGFAEVEPASRDADKMTMRIVARTTAP
jgi:hypothetical protein